MQEEGTSVSQPPESSFSSISISAGGDDDDAGRYSRSCSCRLTDINEHLLCALCSGYLVDATAVIECLHTFCRSCIVRYLESSETCPVCDVPLHQTNPLLGIRLDTTLQTLVYKLVPGVYRDEVKRRCTVVNGASEEGKDASITERLLKDICDMTTGRTIYTGDEKFSVSLQYCPDRSSSEDIIRESLTTATTQNMSECCYLLCPSSVTVGHLKKLLYNKLELEPDFPLELLHGNERLEDFYSLADVAYITAWTNVTPLHLMYKVLPKHLTSALSGLSLESKASTSKEQTIQEGDEILEIDDSETETEQTKETAKAKSKKDKQILSSKGKHQKDPSVTKNVKSSSHCVDKGCDSEKGCPEVKVKIHKDKTCKESSVVKVIHKPKASDLKIVDKPKVHKGVPDLKIVDKLKVRKDVSDLKIVDKSKVHKGGESDLKIVDKPKVHKGVSDLKIVEKSKVHKDVSDLKIVDKSKVHKGGESDLKIVEKSKVRKDVSDLKIVGKSKVHKGGESDLKIVDKPKVHKDVPDLKIADKPKVHKDVSDLKIVDKPKVHQDVSDLKTVEKPKVHKDVSDLKIVDKLKVHKEEISLKNVHRSKVQKQVGDEKIHHKSAIRRESDEKLAQLSKMHAEEACAKANLLKEKDEKSKGCLIILDKNRKRTIKNTEDDSNILTVIPKKSKLTVTQSDIHSTDLIKELSPEMLREQNKFKITGHPADSALSPGRPGVSYISDGDTGQTDDIDSPSSTPTMKQTASNPVSSAERERNLFSNFTTILGSTNENVVSSSTSSQVSEEDDNGETNKMSVETQTTDLLSCSKQTNSSKVGRSVSSVRSNVLIKGKGTNSQSSKKKKVPTATLR